MQFIHFRAHDHRGPRRKHMRTPKLSEVPTKTYPGPACLPRLFACSCFLQVAFNGLLQVTSSGLNSSTLFTCGRGEPDDTNRLQSCTRQS